MVEWQIYGKYICNMYIFINIFFGHIANVYKYMYA